MTLSTILELPEHDLDDEEWKEDEESGADEELDFDGYEDLERGRRRGVVRRCAGRPARALRLRRAPSLDIDRS